jgi:hypothetical protein
MGLTLRGTLAEVLLFIEAVMEPVVSCRQADTCCQWCIVSEDVVASMAAMMKATVVEAPVVRAHTLTGEELLWPAVTQLMLLSLA